MRETDSEAAADLKGLSVPAEAAGQRLDRWLAGALSDSLSRSRLQALIREGRVSVAGVSPREPGHRLAGGEWIEITLPEPEPASPLPEDIPLSVLHEDEHLIVIDKPAGLIVHPGAGNATGTLVNALIHHCGASLSGIGGVRRPGIVHRLDKDTSGVMVVAKTDTAHRALAEAFADHGRTGDLERAYLALAWGAPERGAGRVDAALGRATGDRTLRAVVPEGRSDARSAATAYRVLETFGPDLAPVASLVECRLETGRTHQIRVHMAHIGHPLVGDQDYGRAFATKANLLPGDASQLARGLGRQALHAAILAFRHPATGQIMRFEAPPPEDFAELLDALRSWTFAGGRAKLD